MADNDDLVSLAAELGAALKNRGHVLALAESCTGGWAAQCVTAIPGSSAWFDRGFVTYSNAAKQEMLGVEAHTISSYGAVSVDYTSATQTSPPPSPALPAPTAAARKNPWARFASPGHCVRVKFAA